MNQSRWERLSAIYHATREQPAEARDAYLDRACAGDPEMRGEIESLLRHDLPSLPAFDRLASEPNTLSDQPVAPGTQIGIYRIERALGAGGMGEVHLATDTRLNRPVALKFVSVAADQEARRRFQQETRAVSSLNHPHILTVHDSGQFAGRDYLVTEFVDGGTLKTWLDAAPRTWRQTIELLIGVADALATAHDVGILHRDVKPANILVAQNGYAKLADFGLAKLAGTPDQETRSEPRTGAGVVVGTIDYMSPEQLSGGSVDRRSDVFSFGIVLYEALSGRRPFADATTPHIVEGILRQTPAPLAGDIPVPLREIVVKALEKDPADRYQSMRELVVDLRRSVRHTTEVPAVAALANRRRWWSVAAALVVLLVVAVAAAAWWRSDPVPGGIDPSSIRSMAVLSAGNSSTDPNEEDINDGIIEDISTRLGNAHDVTVIMPASTRLYKASTKPFPEIGRELGVDGILRVSVQRGDGRVRVRAYLIHASTGTQLWAESYDRDVADVFRVQADVAQAIVRELRIQVRPEEAARLAAVPDINPAAHELYEKGRHYLARGGAEGYDKSIAYLEQAIKLQPNYAAAFASISRAWQFKRGQGLTRDTGALYSAAQTAIDLDPTLAEAQAAFGGARFEAWDWTGALAAFEKAWALNPTSMDCGCYAYVLSAVDRLPQALEISRSVLEMNPLSPEALQELGFVLIMMRRYAEAEPYLLQSLELEPRNPAASALLALAYSLKGDAEKAVKAADRPEYRETAVMGRAYALAGRRADAEAILRKIPRANSYGIATVELALGNKDRGLEYLSKAVDDRVGFARFLKVQPEFDKYRSDPRFQEIVARLKLPD